MDASRHNVERIPLDGLERMFCRTYDVMGDAVGASILELGGIPEETALGAAVRDLQARHPRFRVVAQARDQGLEWLVHPADDPPPIRVDYIDTGDDGPSWQEVVHRYLNERLDLQPRPGIRVGVLRDVNRSRSHVFIAWHHALSSGNLVMLHDLMHYYEVRQGSPDGGPPIESLPFLSLGYNCVAKKPRCATWRDGLRARWLRHHREALAARAPFCLVEGRREAPAWEVHSFTPGETAGLVRACRRRRVSTIGMLLAAGMLTQREVQGRKELVSVSGCPLDVRNLFDGPLGPITSADLGNFVTRMVRTYRIGARTDFWRLASKVSDDVHRAYHSGLARQAYIPARGTPPRPVRRNPAPGEAEAVARRRPHLDVNQAGVAPLKAAYAGLAVRSCTQVARRLLLPTGFLLRINAITLQNRMQVFLDPVEFLDPDEVAAFHRSLIAKLIGIAEAG